MKTILLTLIINLYFLLSFSQTSISEGDTLTLLKSSENLYKQAKNSGWINYILCRGDIIQYLNNENNGYFKIILIKGQNISKEYLNDTIYIKSLNGFTNISQKTGNQIIGADIASSRPISPGDELITFTNRYYTGFSLMAIGSAAVTINTLANKSPGSTASKAINIASGVVGLLGLAINLESINHVKNAGILINENGIGIKIPIK